MNWTIWSFRFFFKFLFNIPLVTTRQLNILLVQHVRMFFYNVSTVGHVGQNLL